MYSANFKDYTISKGPRGGSPFEDAAGLAGLGTMAQLARFADRLGVAVDRKGAKLAAARAVLEAVAGENAAEARSAACEGRRPRVVFHLAVAKVDLERVSQPQLRFCLRELIRGKTGVVDVTHEVFDAAVKMACPWAGGSWRNFLWYKSRGYLQGVAA